jgi:hypothetical protein
MCLSKIVCVDGGGLGKATTAQTLGEKIAGGGKNREL